MDAPGRRIRAVSAHLQPPETAARRSSDGLAANPTAGEYAHGTYVIPVFLSSLPYPRTALPQ
jgi:hypothetical protein